MKEGLLNDYLTVLSQQIPVFGSIIRDARNRYSEEEFKQFLASISSRVEDNRDVIENNLILLKDNAATLGKLTTIIKDQYVSIDSKIEGILQIISTEEMNEKIATILSEVKQMEKRLIEKYGENYKKELDKKLTALFYELDHNIEWFDSIVISVSESLKSQAVKGKKEINMPAYKPRVVTMESFLSDNLLGDPQFLSLLTQVHNMTKGVDTVYQKFLNSGNGEVLDQLATMAKAAEEQSHIALINLGFYWRELFSEIYQNYRREINKIYTCPTCEHKFRFFPSPGILQMFCRRCQRPVPLNSQLCPFCKKRQPIIPAYLDVQYEPVEMECKNCHSKMIIKNEDLKLIYRDVS